MTRIVFRPEAEADLAAIGVFIAEHSEERALGFVQRLRSKCRTLETSPMAGRPRSDLGEGLRSLFERPYVLIYRVEGDIAEIVAVFHAARDLPSAVAARIQGKAKH